jgi:hypothetical protein
MEAERSHRSTAKAGAAVTAKPRAAASLTADIVARGRHRTQEYGEAGLWRGPKAPLPSEAPVRVAFPQPGVDVERGAGPDSAVDESVEALRVEAAAAVAPGRPRENEASAAAKSTDDLAPLLFVSVVLFLAVFFIGLLFF